MLADDHAVVRQGIANLIENEPDMEVVAEACDGQEAVALAAKLLPDVILMDLSMPKLNGVEATRIIHNDWPDIRIIGLSMFVEDDRSRAMRDAGAVNYVTKSGPAKNLIAAIRKSVRADSRTSGGRIKHAREFTAIHGRWRPFIAKAFSRFLSNRVILVGTNSFVEWYGGGAGSSVRLPEAYTETWNMS
jgi:DNA-binding NarL/FixJ family response regulator